MYPKRILHALLHSKRTHVSWHFARYFARRSTCNPKESKIHLGYTLDTSRYMYLMRFLDVTLDTYQDHIKIHAKYMQDTCTIHRIRILITNVPKFDNKSTVTPGPSVETTPSARRSRGHFTPSGTAQGPHAPATSGLPERTHGYPATIPPFFRCELLQISRHSKSRPAWKRQPSRR